jgi:hypothetical protein
VVHDREAGARIIAGAAVERVELDVGGRRIAVERVRRLLGEGGGRDGSDIDQGRRVVDRGDEDLRRGAGGLRAARSGVAAVVDRQRQVVLAAGALLASM